MARRPLTEAEIKALWIANGGPISERAIGNSPFGGGGSSIPVASVMARIAILESGGKYWIEVHDSDDDSYGLFQINLKPGANDIQVLKKAVPGLSQPSDLLKATTNTRTAIYLYKQSGFDPWTTKDQALEDVLLKRGEGSLPGTAAGDATGIGSLGNWMQQLGALISAILNPTFWKWLGLGALGIFIVLIATVLFTDTGQSATKAVATKGLKK